jgi:hypothetical protein
MTENETDSDWLNALFSQVQAINPAHVSPVWATIDEPFSHWQQARCADWWQRIGLAIWIRSFAAEHAEKKLRLDALAALKSIENFADLDCPLRLAVLRDCAAWALRQAPNRSLTTDLGRSVRSGAQRWAEATGAQIVAEDWGSVLSTLRDLAWAATAYDLAHWQNAGPPTDEVLRERLADLLSRVTHESKAAFLEFVGQLRAEPAGPLSAFELMCQRNRA